MIVAHEASTATLGALKEPEMKRLKAICVSITSVGRGTHILQHPDSNSDVCPLCQKEKS